MQEHIELLERELGQHRTGAVQKRSIGGKHRTSWGGNPSPARQGAIDGHPTAGTRE